VGQVKRRTAAGEYSKQVRDRNMPLPAEFEENCEGGVPGVGHVPSNSRMNLDQSEEKWVSHACPSSSHIQKFAVQPPSH